MQQITKGRPSAAPLLCYINYYIISVGVVLDVALGDAGEDFLVVLDVVFAAGVYLVRIGNEVRRVAVVR